MPVYLPSSPHKKNLSQPQRRRLGVRRPRQPRLDCSCRRFLFLSLSYAHMVHATSKYMYDLRPGKEEFESVNGVFFPWRYKYTNTETRRKIQLTYKIYREEEKEREGGPLQHRIACSALKVQDPSQAERSSPRSCTQDENP